MRRGHSPEERVRMQRPVESRLYDEWLGLSDYSSRGLRDLTSLSMALLESREPVDLTEEEELLAFEKRYPKFSRKAQARRGRLGL